MSFGTVNRKPLGTKADRYSIKTILSPRDEMLDLSSDERKQAVEKTNIKRAAQNKTPKGHADGPEIRQIRGSDPTRGLLLVYPLSPRNGGLAFDDVPVFGIVISFPYSLNAKAISYRLNAVELRRGMIEIEGELHSHWESLEMHPGDAGDWRAHRLAIDGPIACYAAIRNLDSRRGIIFETPIGDAPQGRLRFEAEGISVREQRDFDDGRYRVAANTEQEGYRTIFRVIALDLLAVVDGPMPVTVGWARLQQRIEAWQACLRARRRGLTREEQVGLYGELVCLRVIAATVSMTTALEAWKGPLRGLHDFVLADRALEVRQPAGTTPGSGSDLSISWRSAMSRSPSSDQDFSPDGTVCRWSTLSKPFASRLPAPRRRRAAGSRNFCCGPATSRWIPPTTLIDSRYRRSTSTR